MKKIRVFLIFCLSAVLLFGCSVEKHYNEWVKQGNDYYYYDSNGNKVCDKWQQEGEDWYYLNNNGKMLINCWLNDKENNIRYYLGSDGRMIKSENETLLLKNIDGENYYFNKDGIAITEEQYEVVLKQQFMKKYESKYAADYANYEYEIDKLVRKGDVVGAKLKLKDYNKFVDKNDMKAINDMPLYPSAADLQRSEPIISDDNKAYTFIRQYEKMLK